MIDIYSGFLLATKELAKTPFGTFKEDLLIIVKFS